MFRLLMGLHQVLIHLPDDGLIRLKHAEKTTIIHYNLAHHQSANKTRSYASKAVLVNYMINQCLKTLKYSNITRTFK
jgi:hypothetical protein